MSNVKHNSNTTERICGGCPYCEYGDTIGPSIADENLYYMSIFIDRDRRRMVVELGNDEAVFHIKHCPKCGREL